jgi:cell division protein FtsL
MPAYSFLSDEELTNLTTYLAEWKDKQAAPVAITDSEAGEAGKTTAVIQKPKRELTAGGKVVLGVLIFACVMVTITILTLYKAFKTMVEVNKELHRKAASYRRWRNDSAL